MREIKFRAWDVENKQMIRDAISLTETTIFKRATLDRVGDVVWEQFTDLHDKNGVPIFEGDIVAGYKCKFPVIWENGAFMWGGEFLGHDIDADDQGGVFISPIEGIGCLEIIGNIHQNPELL